MDDYVTRTKKDHSNMYLTQSTTYDHELDYQLDVFGLANISNGSQFTAYAEFIEQINLIVMERKST